MSNAVEYAESVIMSLKNIEEVSTNWWAGDVESTVERLRSESLDDLADWLESDFDDSTDDLGLAYLETALDVWAEVEWRFDRVNVRGARALLTTGGPHVEVSWDGGDEVTVEVWWGSDMVSRTVECSPVALALSVVVENTEASLK